MDGDNINWRSAGAALAQRWRIWAVFGARPCIPMVYGVGLNRAKATAANALDG